MIIHVPLAGVIITVFQYEFTCTDPQRDIWTYANIFHLRIRLVQTRIEIFDNECIYMKC